MKKVFQVYLVSDSSNDLLEKLQSYYLKTVP